MRRLFLPVLVLALGCGQERSVRPETPPPVPGQATAAVSQPVEIRRIPVSSSFIDAIGYDPGSQVLEIEMNRGQHLYRYFDVPPRVFEGIMAASSKGRFFNSRIKGAYRYQRVRPGPNGIGQ